MLPLIDDDAPCFPETSSALAADSMAPGLLAAGGTLRPSLLETAYRRGIFPWSSAGQPVLWWSPDPRMVLEVDAFAPKRSLRQAIDRFRRSRDCVLRIDSDFPAVIAACAGTPRGGQHGTWILPELRAAYVDWHRLGRVHSVETWIGGELVGGLYGVSIGRMFFGESMFSRRTDASKIAFAALVCFCRARGIGLIDCQQHTAHLASLGARDLPRAEFEAALHRLLDRPDVIDWSYHDSMWSNLAQPETTALPRAAA